MSVITDFDPWKNSLCSCPKKFSLSAYTGCNHNCLYCYASSYIPKFSFPREKKDFLNRLNKEITKLEPNSTITIANSSDPYLPLEKKLKITRKILQILSKYDIKLLIVTKSDLILRDLDILKNFKNIVIAFTITSLNKNLCQKLEPNAPLPIERLKAVETISKYIPVICRVDPLIYNLNTKEKDLKNLIQKISLAGAKQIISSTYKAKSDNLKKMINFFPENKNLWHKLYLEEGEKKGSYIYMEKKLRLELISKIRTISLENKLEFSSCREGFENLNTLACDGSDI